MEHNFWTIFSDDLLFFIFFHFFSSKFLTLKISYFFSIFWSFFHQKISTFLFFCPICHMILNNKTWFFNITNKIWIELNFLWINPELNFWEIDFWFIFRKNCRGFPTDFWSDFQNFSKFFNLKTTEKSGIFSSKMGFGKLFGDDSKLTSC